MSGQKKSVWFITGCSTGFGRELAKQLLENDYRVVVTARDVNKVQDLVEINSANIPETAPGARIANGVGKSVLTTLPGA